MMKSYLMSKVDVIANDPNYFKILMNEAFTTELAEILGINMDEVRELRELVKSKKEENEKIENKEFVFGEFQTLLGVYKLHSDRPNRKYTELIFLMFYFSE